MNVRRDMVFVQAQDDAERAHKLLLASGQEFGGLCVDGLSPEHIHEVLQRPGLGYRPDSEKVGKMERGHSLRVGLDGPG